MMRPWHWISISFSILLATLIILGKLKGDYRFINIAKKICGVVCLLAAVYFGVLGGFAIASGHGLGSIIGAGFLSLIVLPCIALSIFCFRKQSKKKFK
ncbi:hypothetical protein ACFL28_02015 [Candidatus Omnitrophota bacterium]